MLKYPRPGKVKTRLAEKLGEEMAARLYRCFVAQVLAACRGLSCDILLCCHPDQGLKDYKAWIGSGYKYMMQDKGDLGNKMQDAFEKAFEQGFEQAILIGTDVPQLTRAILVQALQGVEQCGSVLGPALDGGYYLLGLDRRKIDSGLFRQIPWSTSKVLKITLSRLKTLHTTPYILQPLRDMDTLEDFKSLCIGQTGLDPEVFSSWNEAVEAYLASQHCP